MANPIRRFVQLILDRDKAKKLESDAKATLGGVENSLNSLGRVAKQIGAAIASIFAIRKVFGFAADAVHEAAEAEAGFSRLRGAVEAAGTAFGPLEANVRAAADAFQGATTHTDDEFNESLQRMIVLTGSVKASLTNMGLVANVAAAFYGDDLAPAVELVSKVMNGNVTAVQKLVGHVGSAREALERLASRSLGAAEAAASTFGGQLKQVNNLWGEFKEQLGAAVVGSDASKSALTAVRDVILFLTEAVVKNRDAIKKGLVTALEWLVDIVDGVYRGVKGLGELLLGSFAGAIAVVATPIAGLAGLFALLIEGAEKVSDVLGLKGATKALGDFGDKVWEVYNEFMKPLGKSVELLGKGVETFSHQTATAKEVLDRIHGKGGTRKRTPVGTDKPLVGDNAETDSDKKLREALLAFNKAMAAAETQGRALGDQFDTLGAKSAALQTVIKAFAEEGVLPEASAQMRGWVDDLGAIIGQKGALDFARGLAAIRAEAAALGPEFDGAGAQAEAFEAEIKRLISQGADPASEAIRNLAAAARALQEQGRETNAFRQFEQDMARLDATAAALGPRLDDEGKPIDAYTQRIEDLSARLSIAQARLAALKPNEQGWDEAIAQVGVYESALGKAQAELHTIKEVGHLAAEAVGAALDGGLGNFAKAKARANLLRAAEETAEGIAASFSLFGAVNAPKHFAAAAKFAAIAVGWAALAKSGIGSSPGGGGAGGGAGGARDANAKAADRSEQPAPQVSIYLTGPGFTALNPEVQKVVYGAMKAARERYGDNVQVRLQMGAG